MVRRTLEPAAPASVRAARRAGWEPQADLPQQLAPREPEAIASPDPHEVLDGAALEPGWRAPHEVADARERPAPLPLDDRRGRGLLTPVAQEAEPHPYPALPHRAPHVARVHVRQPDLEAVALGVAAQRVERVEPHRLVVEERAVILARVVVPESGRLACEQS